MYFWCQKYQKHRGSDSPDPKRPRRGIEQRPRPADDEGSAESCAVVGKQQPTGSCCRAPQTEWDYLGVVYYVIRGFCFLRFAPFGVTAYQWSHSATWYAEIARKKRELILAISASQGSKLKKRNLGGCWISWAIMCTHLWVASNKCMTDRSIICALVRHQ